MSFVYPWVLGATLAAVAGVIAAHLLSVRRPPELLLPTAMFLDDRKVRAVARATRPSDRWLLLLRIAALLLAGLALAGMTWTGRRAAVVSIVVLDARGNADAGRAAAGNVEGDPAEGGSVAAGSADVNDSPAWRDAIERAMRATGTDSLPVVVVWSSGRVQQFPAGAALDSVWPSDSGTLASAMLTARRAASTVAMRADSIELHVVSLLREDVTTSALEAARDTWPGRISVYAVDANGGRAAEAGAETGSESGSVTGSEARAQAVSARRSDTRVDVRSDTRDDVVAAAFAVWGGAASAPVRIVRGALSSDDSAFAQAGGATVHWPVEGARDAEAEQLPAVVANGRVLIGAGIERLSEVDSVGSAIAWWADGSPAATERTYGAGCIRAVAFTAPVGDALLGASAGGVLSALAAPCGARGAPATPSRLTERQLERLQGTGPLAEAAPYRTETSDSPMAKWLLLVAVGLLVPEMMLRARPVTPA